MKNSILVAFAAVLAGCIVSTTSEDYSVDETGSGGKLPYCRVENLDDVQTFDKSAIPVVVKTENKSEELYNSSGIHGLLWLCTLGVVPSWQTEAETHTMNVATPLGEKSGVCTVTKRMYWGWIPYLLPFGSSTEDAQCEEELLSRLVSQWKGEWTADKVEKMNAANTERINALRARADALLAQKKYMEVMDICKNERSKSFVAEYMPKAKAILKSEAETAMRNKDWRRAVDMLKNENASPESRATRTAAIVNLIANDASASTIDGLLKEFARELALPQLAEIERMTQDNAVKSKLAALQASMIEASDRKIEAEIKNYIQRKKDELKKKVEIAKRQRGGCSFSEYYHVDNDDAQFFAELLARVNDTAKLCDIVNKDLGGKGAGEFAKTLVSGLREDALVALLGAKGIDYEFRPAIMERIDSKDVLCRLALKEEDATWQFKGSSVGERALEKIDDKATLVKIVLLAKNEVVSRQAEKKLNDPKAIIIGLTELLCNGKIDEQAAESHVKALSDGEATVAMYNAAKSKSLKELIFEKLNVADRKTIRQGDAAKCKQLIAEAKGKATETFELGGFYLGMDIEDANLLIGYYFPEWSTRESVDSDEKDIRVVYVPQQDQPFCRADKDRKVYQFNFGKKMLKKWYKYDASTIQDWAQAYSREHGIDLKFDFINRSDTVYLPKAMFQLESYYVSLHQEIWTYKSGMKNYRLTYFGERQFGGERSLGLAKYQHRSASEGTFRAEIEND